MKVNAPLNKDADVVVSTKLDPYHDYRYGYLSE